jgi:hypothetical protein
VIQVELLPVDDSIIGDYFNDDVFRLKFQQWLNARWVQKDQQIAAYLGAADNPIRTELDCSSSM